MPLTKRLLCLILAFFVSALAMADNLRLRADHPDRYIVKKGDTLWDISARFLEDPWRWPDIWHVNPEIDNPHLIFPGDIIDLYYRNGRPELRVQRHSRPLQKLSPSGRVSPLPMAITTLPADTIRQFLKRPRILSREELDSAAYIVANDGGHLISATDHKVYVRGIEADDGHRFVVIHEGKVYRDPRDDDRILGYEALTVADGQLLAGGDPAVLHLVRSTREVLIDDRVLPADDSQDILPYFTPHAPAADIEGGEILAVLDGISRIGQYNTIIINKGSKDGIDAGLVMAVYQTGETIDDPRDEDEGEVKLPDERAGTIMVVRAFENLSYALVMRATRDMQIGDRIAKP